MGRRTTSTAPRPIAARTPVSREVSRVPRRRTSSPRAMSVPAKVTPDPGATGRSTSSRPSPRDRRVLDHDDGVGPAREHAPGGDRRGRARRDRRSGGRRPVASSSSLSRSRRGDSSAAPKVSSARTAKPSTFERSKAGHVDLGDDVRGQDPPERLGQRDLLGLEHAGRGSPPTSDARPCRGRRRPGTGLARVAWTLSYLTCRVM